MWLQCAVPETVVSACLALPAAGNEDPGGARSGPRASHIADTRMHERRVRIDYSAVIQVRNLYLCVCVCVCVCVPVPVPVCVCVCVCVRCTISLVHRLYIRSSRTTQLH